MNSIPICYDLKMQGDCFRWALWDAANNGGMLVHGWVRHPFDDNLSVYAHAWVERDGMVYDWQRCQQHIYSLGPCPQPIEEFDAAYLPENMARYPGNARLVGRAYAEGNYGPWHPEPWSDVGWKPRENPDTEICPYCFQNKLF